MRFAPEPVKLQIDNVFRDVRVSVMPAGSRSAARAGESPSAAEKHH
jgi:hypothetical protein